MWTYINPTCIYNEEVEIYFIKQEFPDLWRIEPVSKDFIYESSKASSKEIKQYIYRLELECTLWAHGRSYKDNLQAA